MKARDATLHPFPTDQQLGLLDGWAMASAFALGGGCGDAVRRAVPTPDRSVHHHPGRG